jgi:hypothetical protein
MENCTFNCINGWIVHKTVMVKCPICNNGHQVVKFTICPSCKGEGGYRRTSFLHNDLVQCAMCGGKGHITYEVWRDDMKESCLRPKS